MSVSVSAAGQLEDAEMQTIPSFSNGNAIGLWFDGTEVSKYPNDKVNSYWNIYVELDLWLLNSQTNRFENKGTRWLCIGSYGRHGAFPDRITAQNQLPSSFYRNDFYPGVSYIDSKSIIAATYNLIYSWYQAYAGKSQLYFSSRIGYNGFDYYICDASLNNLPISNGSTSTATWIFSDPTTLHHARIYIDTNGIQTRKDRRGSVFLWNAGLNEMDVFPFKYGIRDISSYVLF